MEGEEADVFLPFDDHPGESPRIANVVPETGLEVSEDGLIESGSVPGGNFGCHKQKASPIGDAFSYFLSVCPE
jgi:hypothetical protein